MKINVLGSEWSIEYRNTASDPLLKENDGYADYTIRLIIIANKREDAELIDDERFNSNDKRNKNHDELRALMVEALKGHTTKEWIGIFEAAGVPCGPVNNIADVMDDEQVKARNMIVSIYYPDMGVVKAPGCPIKSREYEIDPKIPAPDLGANNEEFFG